jgi:hypothetical protein
MNKLERPLIEKYWKQVGGSIIFEFPMVQRSATCGPRYLDALILPKKGRKILKASEVTNGGRILFLFKQNVEGSECLQWGRLCSLSN